MRIEQAENNHVILFSAPLEIRARVIEDARHAVGLIRLFGVKFPAQVKDGPVYLDGVHMGGAVTQRRGHVVTRARADHENVFAFQFVMTVRQIVRVIPDIGPHVIEVGMFPYKSVGQIEDTLMVVPVDVQAIHEYLAVVGLHFADINAVIGRPDCRSFALGNREVSEHSSAQDDCEYQPSFLSDKPQHAQQSPAEPVKRAQAREAYAEKRPHADQAADDVYRVCTDGRKAFDESAEFLAERHEQQDVKKKQKHDDAVI